MAHSGFFLPFPPHDAHCRAVTLRQKLDELLEIRGWSRSQLARTSSVSVSALQHAIAGKTLSVLKGISLAKALDVPIEWLFDDTLGWEGLIDLPFWWPPGVKPPGGREVWEHRPRPDDPAQRAIEEARTADEAVEAALRAEGVTLPPAVASRGSKHKRRRAADARPRKRA